MVPSRDVFITPSLALGLIRVLVNGKPPDLALSGSSAWRGAQAGSDKIRSFPEKKRGPREKHGAPGGPGSVPSLRFGKTFLLPHNINPASCNTQIVLHVLSHGGKVAQQSKDRLNAELWSGHGIHESERHSDIGGKTSQTIRCSQFIPHHEPSANVVDAIESSLNRMFNEQPGLGTALECEPASP
jgi:hypothetical protein